MSKGIKIRTGSALVGPWYVIKAASHGDTWAKTYDSVPFDTEHEAREFAAEYAVNCSVACSEPILLVAKVIAIYERNTSYTSTEME